MSVGDYLVRAADADDLAAFLELKELAGPGFTSLAIGEDVFAERLAESQKSYAADVTAPGDERYFLALVHRPTKAIVGMAQVKAAIGASQPFFNFRIFKIAQASAAASRRFDMDVLILVNEFAGCAEVGSLFVRKEHRLGGVGRALAQSRYMLMAAHPQRFGPRVVAELRGVVSPEGQSPFWDHLGRQFFRMEFREADRLSATTDNQFILDLMPRHPVYADLLPQEARDVIGRCHPEGEGARKLLEWEGFRHDNVIDIFDGGPLVTAPRDAIRTLREARRLKLAAGAPKTARAGLIATASIANFRCVPASAEVRGEDAVVAEDAIAALGLKPGDEALIWQADGA